MKKFILSIIFSKHELAIILEALREMEDRCKIALNETCQDTVFDIYKIRKKLPKGNRNFFE
jgi:hypothetical protein